MRIAVSISGDAKKARQSSDTILFRKNNFKQYFKEKDDYKKYMYGYYCYQYLLDIEKKEEILNVFSRNVNVVGITDKRVVNGILSKVEVTE